MPCAYTFTLSRESNQDRQSGGYAGHWLKVTCTAATAPEDVDETTAIFVYQRERVQNIDDPAADKVHSFFSNVACPNDLEEIAPEAEPADVDVETPHFRLDYFEAYFQSRAELETCWADIQLDVSALKKALQHRCAQADEPEVVVI